MALVYAVKNLVLPPSRFDRRITYVQQDQGKKYSAQLIKSGLHASAWELLAYACIYSEQKKAQHK